MVRPAESLFRNYAVRSVSSPSHPAWVACAPHRPRMKSLPVPASSRPFVGAVDAYREESAASSDLT